VEAWLTSKVGVFGTSVILGANFLVKVIVLCWVQLSIRWTLPKFRFDQIQTLGWKILLPLALANIFITGILLLVDPSFDLLAMVGIAEIVFLVGLTVLYPVKQPTSVVYRERDAVAGGQGGN
jgi:NADH-quinone oxidoreductase subunit H